jgi:hypothetical protein
MSCHVSACFGTPSFLDNELEFVNTRVRCWLKPLRGREVIVDETKRSALSFTKVCAEPKEEDSAGIGNLVHFCQLLSQR